MEQHNYRPAPRATSYTLKVDCTVEEFFSRYMDGKSRTAQKQLLSKGAVRAGGRVVRRLDAVLLAGTTVVVAPRPEPQFVMPSGLRILYEDDWLLVVNKDAGLLTIATETEREHTAYSYLSAYLKFHHRQDKVYIVHRLDRGTSGVLLFAKTPTAQQTLRQNWDSLVHSREYVAVAQGHFLETDGTITTWLAEDPATYQMYVCRPGQGKRAVTHYHVMSEAPGFSLVSLQLDTGRKNQIRVHLRHVGHTIAGDRKYGALTDPIGRLCLHARQIEFEHPMTGRLMNFETRVPAEFERLFRKQQ